MAEDATFQTSYAEGINKFQGLRSRGFWREIIDLLRGKSTELLSFHEIRARLQLHEEIYRGLQDVPLEQIVGSVGRYKDFSQSFLPRSNDMKDRWSRVYAKANSLEGLPPIELYKVGETYFVRDGNHRVSVARELDAKTIEAHVTELPTSIPMRPGITDEELDAAEACAIFLEETGLKQLSANNEPIELSFPGRYHELRGHIFLHAQIMEQVSGKPVSTKEAAVDWYDQVYLPAVKLIQKYDVLELANETKRTMGDLYLWMVDHLRDVRHQYGDEAETRKFSQALMDYLQEKKIDVPDDLPCEDDDSVLLTRTQAIKAVQQKQAEEDEHEE